MNPAPEDEQRMWTLTSEMAPPDCRTTFRVMPGAAKTLGRATRADFVLDAALVSRLHCRFTACESGELEVEDLHSTNGTFVNGQRVERARLASGDRVRVGRVELSVELGVEREQGPTERLDVERKP